MKQITLNATSPFEEPIDRKTGALIWDAFLSGGTNHSARAATLPYIIRRCERAGQGYVLHARPGYGYFIRLRRDTE